MKDYEATGAPRAHNVAFPRYMLHVMHKKISNYNKLMHYAIFMGADLSAYCLHVSTPRNILHTCTAFVLFGRLAPKSAFP